MNFKDVCGEAESVWFVLSDKRKEGRRFLKWAKELGCVWLNGREIEPNGGTEFFVLSISSRGTLANVPAMAVASTHDKNGKAPMGGTRKVFGGDFDKRVFVSSFFCKKS